MYKMSGIYLMPLNNLASWLKLLFEAICLPQAWKVPGSNVGSHITHGFFADKNCKHLSKTQL